MLFKQELELFACCFSVKLMAIFFSFTEKKKREKEKKTITLKHWLLRCLLCTMKCSGSGTRWRISFISCWRRGQTLSKTASHTALDMPDGKHMITVSLSIFSRAARSVRSRNSHVYQFECQKVLRGTGGVFWCPVANEAIHQGCLTGVAAPCNRRRWLRPWAWH